MKREKRRKKQMRSNERGDVETSYAGKREKKKKRRKGEVDGIHGNSEKQVTESPWIYVPRLPALVIYSIRRTFP